MTGQAIRVVGGVMIGQAIRVVAGGDDRSSPYVMLLVMMTGQTGFAVVVGGDDRSSRPCCCWW